MPDANNKDADQPADLRSLISIFVIHSLDCTIPIDTIPKILTLSSFCSCSGWFESYLVVNSQRQVFFWWGSLVYFQKQASSVRELESKVRSHKQSPTSSPVPKEEHDTLKREYDDQTKETRILRKTVDEMELRLETQKQTLAARDGSIKKLLEMLQSKGLAADKIEESQKELEKVRVGKIEDQKTIKELRDSVSVKERNIVDLKEVGAIFENSHTGPGNKLCGTYQLCIRLT